jgi:hypothetical protein
MSVHLYRNTRRHVLNNREVQGVRPCKLNYTFPLFYTRVKERINIHSHFSAEQIFNNEIFSFAEVYIPTAAQHGEVFDLLYP